MLMLSCSSFCLMFNSYFSLSALTTIFGVPQDSQFESLFLERSSKRA